MSVDTRAGLDFRKAHGQPEPGPPESTSFTSNSVFSAGVFLNECADSSYNGACASAVGNDFFESPTQNVRLKIAIGEQSQARAAVIRNCSQRLVDFVGYRRRQFAHRRHPGNARKLHLCHLQGVLRLFPIVQIHNAPEPF